MGGASDDPAASFLFLAPGKKVLIYNVGAMCMFTQAVESFLATATYLSDEDLPLVVMLRAIAEQLDGGDTQSALFSQYRQAYNTLAKKRPATAAVDPLDAAVDDLRDDE